MADYFYLPIEKYPSEEFLRIWKLVLLNQFHDILPGSCIKQVKLKCCFTLFLSRVVVFNFRVPGRWLILITGKMIQNSVALFKLYFVRK